MTAPLDPEWLATWEAMPAEARAHVCRLLREEASRCLARHQTAALDAPLDALAGVLACAEAARHLAVLLASLTPGGEA